jgi:hypothetical protein
MSGYNLLTDLQTKGNDGSSVAWKVQEMVYADLQEKASKDEDY